MLSGMEAGQLYALGGDQAAGEEMAGRMAPSAGRLGSRRLGRASRAESHASGT